MPELDHQEIDSHYTCPYCRDTGKLDGSDCYDCGHCSVAEERTKLDERTAAMGRMTISDISWSHVQSVKREIGAKRAAEVALLQAKLRQAERELAEVRQDAERYRHLRDAETLNQTIWDALDGIGSDEPEGYRRGFDKAVDNAILAAKEQA